jgi:lactam utilization protein B
MARLRSFVPESFGAGSGSQRLRPSNSSDVANGFARRDRLHSFRDALRIDAEMAVEIGNHAGLAEMLDT